MSDRIKLNEDGSLDEIVFGGAHLEQMDHNHWFLSMCAPDGAEIVVELRSNSPITVTYEVRDFSVAKAAPRKIWLVKYGDGPCEIADSLKNALGRAQWCAFDVTITRFSEDAD